MAKEMRAEPVLPFTYDGDPVAYIGVMFFDLEQRHCRFIVARDPEDYSHRFCGEERVKDGRGFLSAYCCRHHALTHQGAAVKEAAE